MPTLLSLTSLTWDAILSWEAEQAWALLLDWGRVHTAWHVLNGLQSTVAGGIASGMCPELCGRPDQDHGSACDQDQESVSAGVRARLCRWL